MSQNISIHPNHILTPCTKSTFITSPNFSHQLAPNLPTVFYFPTLYDYLSVKSGPVSFFLSSGTRKSHHLVGYHAYLTNNTFSKNS